MDNLSKDPSTLLPDELSDLVAAFVPSQPSASRSKAYLVLSAFCQGVRTEKRQDEPDQGTLALSGVFQPLIASRLSQSQEDLLLAAVTFHTALFQVDWQSASQIFTEDGFVDLLTTLETNTSVPLSIALARLYAQAGGHKTCRQLFPEESIVWLRTKSNQMSGDALRAVAVLALVKLAHGTTSDLAAAPAGTPSSGVLEPEDTSHAAKLCDVMTDSEDIHACINDVVEGLAYLSVNTLVKKSLSDGAILKRLFSFVPKRKAIADATSHSSLIYGVLVVTSNLCAYKSRMSQEQRQIAKLRRMAEGGKDKSRRDVEERSDPLDSEDEVQSRCRNAISSGALDVLATASVLDSEGIRSSVGRVLLSLAENKENRGEILRGGGSKTLTRIIQSASSTPDSFPQEALAAVQALAKLAITAPPIQVFGPNEGNILDAIRPFSQLLLHPSANMLQQFEAMMALTNIVSHGPTIASRLANDPHVLNKVELLMLEDHTLMRRAATELICNLVAGSEKVFQKYAGVDEDDAASSRSRDRSSRSKIHVLIAMSDVEDIPTKLAASGALAMLTSVRTACEAILDLQIERHRAFLVLAQLIDPNADDGDADVRLGDLGLVHRGVACIHNLLSNLRSSSNRDVLKEEVGKAGLLSVFEKLLKGDLGSFADMVLGPAAEVKQMLS